MAIRPISKELKAIAINELNERTEKIEEDLLHLQEWFKKQPHLNVRPDDQWLVAFLRGCKWSLQRTKEKIDYFYTLRTLIPDVFQNRDPLDPFIQNMLAKGIIYPLPNVEDPNGPRIILWDYSVMDYNTIRFIDLFKLFFMTMGILMVEDDSFVVSGAEFVINYETVPPSFFLQFTPALTKKFIMCWQNAYPLRIKTMVSINVPPALEKIYNIFCKPFCSQKIQDRVHLYSSQNNDKAHAHIPKSVFPEELGGRNSPRSEIIMQWKKKVESYRSWLLDDDKYCSNEQLRPEKPKTYDEEFDMEGTFRQLILD